MARKKGFDSQIKSISDAILGEAVNSQEASILAVEFLQASILHSLFSKDVRTLFLAKGGMAMHYLGSDRRTMDIDLSVPPTSNMTTITNRMRSSINEALKSGMVLNPVVSEVDLYDGYSPKWKVNGFLSCGTQVHLTVELSRRDLIPDYGVNKIKYSPDKKYGLTGYTAKTYSEEFMAASKVSALLDKKRTKTRDLYDLYVLIVTMKVKPPIALLASTGKFEVSRMLENLWGKIDVMDWDKFQTNVLPHLPKEKQIMTSGDYEDMRVFVGRHVEAWLIEALEINAEAVPRDELANKIAAIENLVEINRQRKKI